MWTFFEAVSYRCCGCHVIAVGLLDIDVLDYLKLSCSADRLRPWAIIIESLFLFAEIKKLTQDLARRKHIRSKDGIMGYGLSESFVSYFKRKKKNLLYIL